MESTKKYGNSSFWLDRYENSIDSELLTSSQRESHNLYRLAAKKRAISNFVSIVTSKQIPVKFATFGDSYTDGNSVVISSKLDKDSEFDVAVGLALHEGSHIKLSSFDILTDLEHHIGNIYDQFELNQLSNKIGVSCISSIKDILNWVEDRRIDNFIYQTSPGYRQYYIALYDKYFNDPLIDKALQSNEFTDETFDSYMFRLINLQSKSRRLNALKGLIEISKIADLQRIDRLHSTMDAFEVAVDIYRVILKNVMAAKVDSNDNQSSEGGDSSSNENQNSEEGTKSSGNGNSNSKSKNELSDDEFDELMSSLGLDGESETDDETKSDGDDEITGNSNVSKTGDTENTATDNTKSIAITNLPDNIGDLTNGSSTTDDSEVEPKTQISLTDKQKSALQSKIKKQKEFINGNISKTKIKKSEAASIDVIEAASAEINEVGATYQSSQHWHSIKSISCIFVKNMTLDLISDTLFPLTDKRFNRDTHSLELKPHSKEAVEAGIRLGTILGKKLQTRSESRETVFNRQLTGKLDRRLVSALGHGSEQIFYTKELDNYNKANLHISIDASGSMNGSKWNNTIINVVALAKAVDMIPNLEVQITFRTTTDNSPYILVAYDSRKDKFSKIKQLFPYLRCYGTTPEGLCFEAISKYMVASSNNLDSYFLNISDGEPFYQLSGFYYAGMDAANHTKKMVDNIEKLGIKILSYFVSDKNVVTQNSPNARIFNQSYGKAAKYINVTSVNEVSKTINALFMKK